jgi:CRISPR system Cascade subunit CasD
MEGEPNLPLHPPMFTLLRLNGPLQAWSCTAEPRAKSTWDFPTKAGILGIIASALGIRRGSIEEQDFLKTANKWKLTVFSQFPKTLEGKTCKNNPQIVLDYQTIGNPENPLPGATSRLHPGTPRIKTYLADADFVAALESNPQDAEKMKLALENPHWPPFLGRKHCIPSTPIFISQLEQIPETLRHGLETLHLNQGIQLAETDSSSNAIELSDVPTTFFPSRKTYGHRFVIKK